MKEKQDRLVVELEGVGLEGVRLDWMVDTYAHTPAAVRGHILSTGSSDREHLLQTLQGQTGPYQVTPHHMHVTTHYSYCMRFNFRGD